MKTIKQFFQDVKEVTPTWLNDFKQGDKPSFETILSSRVVYYPGSRFDGQPIRTFNNAHYAHVFFYVDYDVDRDTIIEELSKDNALKGYKKIGIIEYLEKDITPRGWKPHYVPNENEAAMARRRAMQEPNYCLVFIFERTKEYTDEHGANRIAVICLKADGIATYDALFANRGKAPNVLILQDHGFGGNYNWFGREGALNKIAIAANCFPHYILCADNTHIWEKYEKVPNVQHAFNGMHMRWLYRYIG